MFAKLSSVLVLAVSFKAVIAQVSTASLFPVGFQDDGLQGQVKGSGAGGTTFVLSGTFGTFGIPYTMTLVEDATHVSEGAVIATALESLTVDVQCGIAGVNAVCTEKIDDAASATTIVESGVVELVPVPIQVGTGPITSAASSLPPSASITFVSGSATSSVASQTSVSVLPPVLSTSRASTSSIATVITPSALNPTASSASGASRVTTTGLSMLLPILAMMFASYL